MISRTTLTTEFLAWPLCDAGIDVAEGTEAEFSLRPVAADGTSAAPGDADWLPGVIAPREDGSYDLAILVGPVGGVALPAGLYRVWVRIAEPEADDQERPVRALDWLEVV